MGRPEEIHLVTGGGGGRVVLAVVSVLVSPQAIVVARAM